MLFLICSRDLYELNGGIRKQYFSVLMTFGMLDDLVRVSLQHSYDMENSVLNIFELDRAQLSETKTCLELEHHCQRSQSVNEPGAVDEVVPGLLKDEYHLTFRIHLSAVLFLMDLTEHPLTVNIDLTE